jgi:hypothetical protein
LLPRGHPWRFAPELDSAAAEEVEGSIGLGSVEEEVALEEEGEARGLEETAFKGRGQRRCIKS